MLRAMRYAVVLALLVAAAVWLAEQPGAVTLVWRGYRLDTSVSILVFAVAVIAAIAALVYRFWRFLRHAPATVTQAWRDRRRRHGYEALTRGMVAVAAGDAEEARRQVRRAEGLLNEPPLTLLLSAQAAQLAGDDRAAAAFFESMTKRPETEFLGLRGLLTQALRRGDTVEALALARRAFRLRPKGEWVATQLFDLEVSAHRWLDARATTEDALTHDHLTKDQARGRHAVLACQMGRDAGRRGDREEALRLAREAYGLDAGLVPAALELARLLVEDGKHRKAAKIIEETWRRSPHPDLVALYWRAREAEAALARVKASERLAAVRPEHRESALAIASAALPAQLWGEARKHLEQAAGADAPARVYRMLAELEEAGHGDLARAREWLMQASLADPDPAWVCRTCGNATADWSAVCGKCGTFDGFGWAAPSHAARLESAPSPRLLAETAAPEKEGAS